MNTFIHDGLSFVEVPREAMGAIQDGDVALAAKILGLDLPGYYTTARPKRQFGRRYHQLADTPGDAHWVTRLVVSDVDSVVGHAGWHGAPDAEGTAELAYTTVREHRRKGYATRMLAGLLAWAASEPSVVTVRATIAPDNAASLATAAKFGFAQVGEQIDPEDGVELIFERAAR
ncbi:hypothetical protein Afil01_45610 [Actinorhabdospora filicis]|uniref:N-acetyltransferase domain-containing protein n=1 Tax=Actinorhabdospora filicis TaxID=1785913 RepID=A0A9W6SMP8_9ACTN|nr:GNAT family N-acetyltransferase [Actinorhabdospora filicis]GLZ79754.1 hypothetical protein Afil01_45610 [Actinorhabdospora filicis]